MSEIVVHILQQHFEKKKKDFPGLSTVWLARKLEVSQVYVSLIMSGKRPLPNFLINPMADLLDMDSETRDKVTSEILKAQGWTDERSQSLGALESKQTTTLHEKWKSLPSKDFSTVLTPLLISILESTSLKDYDGSIEFLCTRLNLSPEVVKESVKSLVEAGHLIKKGGRLQKTNALLEAHSNQKRKHIVEFHTEVLERAKKEMADFSSKEDLENRLISTALFTCSKEQIPRLRLKLAEILKEISSEGANETPEEVYHLGVLLFPATRSSDPTTLHPETEESSI